LLRDSQMRSSTWIAGRDGSHAVASIIRCRTAVVIDVGDGALLPRIRAISPDARAPRNKRLIGAEAARTPAIAAGPRQPIFR